MTIDTERNDNYYQKDESVWIEAGSSAIHEIKVILVMINMLFFLTAMFIYKIIDIWAHCSFFWYTQAISL
jgi:hypothetical protein